MYARVTTFQVKRDKLDHVIRAYEHEAIGTNQRERGFLRNLLLTDAQAQKALAITFWETQEDLEASMDAHEQRIARTEELDLLTAPPTTEVYAVSVDTQPYE